MPREGMRQRRSGRDAGPSGLMRMSIIHWVGSAGSDFQNRDAQMGLYQVVRQPSAYRAGGGSGPVTRQLDLLYS
jgi:hypothetical protein